MRISRRSFGPDQRQNLPICRYFTGATGREPATSGVTGRYNRNRYSRLRPGITGWSRHFVSARTGSDRLRPATARQDMCCTCVVDLFAIKATSVTFSAGARVRWRGRRILTATWTPQPLHRRGWFHAMTTGDGQKEVARRGTSSDHHGPAGEDDSRRLGSGRACQVSPRMLGGLLGRSAAADGATASRRSSELIVVGFAVDVSGQWAGSHCRRS
jgi:hypothetical protein